MKGFIAGLALGLVVSGSVAYGVMDDDRRPYFGFTPQGTTPVDQSGNQYSGSLPQTKSPAPGWWRKDPC